jgi:ubiquinone/menaquinone biosynthesis C-methylase UbiE
MKKAVERCDVVGLSPRDHADHISRYRFAAQFAVGKKVLDIACGIGYGSQIMLDAGASSVTGVDISRQAIEAAHKKYPNVCFRAGDITAFSDDHLYDVIVTFETIEHVDDYIGALENLRRLLSSDGMLIISTPNRTVNSPECKTINDRPPNPFHLREFTAHEMRKALFSSGFTVVKEYGQKFRKPLTNCLLRLVYYIVSAKLRLAWGQHFRSDVTPSKPGILPRYSVFVCRCSPNPDKL